MSNQETKNQQKERITWQVRVREGFAICYKNNLNAVMGRRGISRGEIRRKKREVLLQSQLKRQRGDGQTTKVQHLFTNVLQNNGNMADTTSFCPSPIITNELHIAAPSAHFPSSCASVHWGISTSPTSPGCRLE